MKHVRLSMLTAFAFAAFSGCGAAQVIRFTNASNLEVPLKPGSTVSVDAAGSLNAECVLANGTCSGLAVGNGGALPVISLTRVDGDADLNAGEYVKLAWSATGGNVCEASSTGPGNTWSGPRANANQAGETVPIAAAGTYVFKLSCYNSSGVAQSSLSASAGLAGPPQPPPQPAGDCTLNTATTPLYQPAGWAMVSKTWAALFTPQDGGPVPTYPSSNGFPVPLGSNKGSYVAASFTAQANQTVNMFWDPAQANKFEGYDPARPASGMFISISPCAGDLRPADNSGGFLMAGCRKYANTATLTFSTKSALAASTVSACKLEAGKTYYLNVLPANPNDGLTLGEHSCSDTPSSFLGCDVQSKSELTP